MSLRKYTAAGVGLFAASVLVGAGLVGAQAAPGAKLPKITGGGHTQNQDGGGMFTNFGGITAHATAPALSGDAGEWEARGQIQGRSQDDASHQTNNKVHGTVVCIADRGPATADTGGDQTSGAHVWELRFRVEKSTVGLVNGRYMSIFVQDNGPHGDYSDEHFQVSEMTNPECGDATGFQLEPHKGQVTVHD